MKEETVKELRTPYTSEQMTLWGQLNMVIGALAITAVHFGTLLFGIKPLDLVFQGILLIVLALVGYLYYRLYRKTKEIDK